MQYVDCDGACHFRLQQRGNNQQKRYLSVCFIVEVYMYVLFIRMATIVCKCTWLCMNLYDCVRVLFAAKYGTPNTRIEELFRLIPRLRELGVLHHKWTMVHLLKQESKEGGVSSPIHNPDLPPPLGVAAVAAAASAAVDSSKLQHHMTTSTTLVSSSSLPTSPLSTSSSQGGGGVQHAQLSPMSQGQASSSSGTL